MRFAFRLAAIGVAVAGAAVFGQGDVDKVLADARQALGGDQKLEAVKTITATGRTVRTMPNGTSMEGDFEMALDLPDKFVRRDVLAAMGNMSVYRLSGFNGDEAINETDTPPQLSTGNVVVHMRFAGPGGGDPATMTPEQKEAARQAMVQSAKRDFTRLALGMLLKTLPSYPLTYSYGGTAESPDGTADVIDVKGANFAARLFIDGKTHLPLMLSWTDKEPLRVVRQIGGPGGGQSGDLEKIKQQEMEDLKAAEAKRRTVEYRLYYADYQPVDGMMLPHRIQSSVDGKPTEEITLEKLKVNQKIDAKRFTVSK